MNDLAKLAIDQGVGAVAVIAGTGMLWYLVRFTVVQMSVHIRDMAESINKFTDKVKDEHGDQREAHKQLQQQHNEMMVEFKEITTTLGRINGYKKDGE